MYNEAVHFIQCIVKKKRKGSLDVCYFVIEKYKIHIML